MANVFLTFDDGPLGGTDDVLAVLRRRKVDGTLFMVSNHLNTDWRRRRLKEAQDSVYAEVANHSKTHANNQYKKYYADPGRVGGVQRLHEGNSSVGPGRSTDGSFASPRAQHLASGRDQENRQNEQVR